MSKATIEDFKKVEILQRLFYSCSYEQLNQIQFAFTPKQKPAKREKDRKPATFSPRFGYL